MTDSTSSRNNLLHPQSSSPVAIRHTPDPEFYDNHKVIVLLVGATLFKFQASRLAPDPGVEQYELKSYLEDALDPSKSIENQPGSSDELPIVLPKDITVAVFRDLLRVLSGGVLDRKFMRLVSDLRPLFGFLECRPTLVDRLSKLGYLASRLGMNNLDKWAQAHIYKILRDSGWKLEQGETWDTTTILQLVQHMRMTSVTDYRSKIFRAIKLALGAQIGEVYTSSDDLTSLFDSTIVRVCTALFKDKTLSTDAPDIFGFVFAVVLSLGHRSPIWANDLTREDRRVLYASNSIFTCLRDRTDLGVGWLVNSTDMSRVINDCPGCSSNSNFNTWWDDGFGNCKGLNSSVLLEDIRHIARLPHYRGLFHNSIGDRSCKKGCPTRLLAYVDEHMEFLYRALTKEYKHLEETV